MHRLTGLEIEKLLEEYGSILDDIAEREAILADPERLAQVIREELSAVRSQFGDERRSVLMNRTYRYRLKISYHEKIWW